LTQKTDSYASEAGPFIWVALAWLLCATAYCWISTAGDRAAVFWLVVIWGLAMADLAATAGAIRAVLRVTAVSGENRPAAAIQAFTWGTVKLACLGLIIALMMRSATLPVASLLLGLGTMFGVPVVGGLWWSQRILKHA
jgi:hypothetical protein